MRLLILIRDLDLGGTQRQVVHIAAGLARRGHEVVVVCWREGGPLEAELGALQIPVATLHSRWRGDLLGLGTQVRKIIRQRGIEIVYCMMPVENLVGLVATSGTTARLVWGIRTSPDALRHSGTAQRALFVLQRMLSRRPDAIIANSSAGEHVVGAARRMHRVHVIRNGVDTTRFRPDPEIRRSARSRLALESGAIVLVAVGRIEAQKGIEDLLLALARVIKDIPKLRLMLVGRMATGFQTVIDGLLEAHALQTQVRLVPQLAAIESVYAAADILVSPSRGEGMSNVVAEAMACGVAVVATRVGENESLVGTAGWLVPAGDIAALAEALRAAINADRVPLGIAARNRIQDGCSVESLVARSEAVLLGVLH